MTVKRAQDAGFEGLVLTVDSPVYNNRETDIRNGLVFPPTIKLNNAIDAILHPRWLFGTFGRYLVDEGHLPAFSNIHVPEKEQTNVSGYVSAASKGFLNRNETLDWDFVKRLRDMWEGKLLIKSVLHPDDAAHNSAIPSRIASVSEPDLRPPERIYAKPGRTAPGIMHPHGALHGTGESSGAAAD